MVRPTPARILPVLAWTWVAAVLAAYLWQFLPLVAPILKILS